MHVDNHIYKGNIDHERVILVIKIRSYTSRMCVRMPICHKHTHKDDVISDRPITI